MQSRAAPLPSNWSSPETAGRGGGGQRVEPHRRTSRGDRGADSDADGAGVGCYRTGRGASAHQPCFRVAGDDPLGGARRDGRRRPRRRPGPGLGRRRWRRLCNGHGNGHGDGEGNGHGNGKGDGKGDGGTASLLSVLRADGPCGTAAGARTIATFTDPATSNFSDPSLTARTAIPSRPPTTRRQLSVLVSPSSSAREPSPPPGSRVDCPVSAPPCLRSARAMPGIPPLLLRRPSSGSASRDELQRASLSPFAGRILPSPTLIASSSYSTASARRRPARRARRVSRA